MKKAILMLESGKVYSGFSFGADGEKCGEVVFNTGMVGYQEILTDPSYCGQIVTMTYVHIGNYGINNEDIESFKPFVEGFAVREVSKIVSNWRSKITLQDYLIQNKIVAIEGIDTRSLTKHIREKGAMKGIISTIDFDEKSLIKKIKAFPDIVGRDLVKHVTHNYIMSSPVKIKETPQVPKFKVVVIDCGVKYNILRCLIERSCELTIVPADTNAEKILEFNPDGVVLSNGPGDPQPLTYVIKTVEKLLYKKIPIFGICLGHQILGLACGGKIYKLKFGHHGINHPVKDLSTGKIEITSQNHGFCVKMIEKQPGKWLMDGNEDIEITHINLNDITCEGMKHKKLPVFSLQYHPESAPGPYDSRYLFDVFIKSMKFLK